MSGVNPYPYKRPVHSDASSSPVPDESREKDHVSGSVRVSSKATRRIRGEIACAECRRLKIRCDKIVPCSTCVKRGCSALCPNGTIPPGDGSRFVLAATDHLHKKMSKLEARMHSLEDAIAIIYANTSDQPHPLLVLQADDDDDDGPILKPVIEETETPSPALADSLGSLHLDNRGGARFFGPSGGSESLLLKAKELEESIVVSTGPLIEDLDHSYLPPEINKCVQSFPFTPLGVMPSAVQTMIETFLPPMQRAITLCEVFLEHLSWMFHIVSRQQMVKELIPTIYRKAGTYGPHDLALMLIVLGIGSLVDLTLQPYNLEAQHYYRLSRASLSLQSILTDDSVVTIKVLHLMSIYNGMSGKESNLEQSYLFLDLAGQVALRIGFHVDPSLWGFRGKEAYERRVYFWNLVAATCWQSLVTGRPPGMLTAYFDCHIPTAEEENLYQQGEVPLGFGIWGFRASVECLIPVVKAVLAIKPPSYQTVLELDREIRNLTNPLGDNRHDQRTAISMQSFVRSHYQDLILMFLHRGFFAQGMAEHLPDPLNSPVGPSVLAAYQSACVILDDTKVQFTKQPLLCTRIWRIWSLAFSASIIVGTVAIRGIHLKLQPSAFEEFKSACDMFRRAAETSNRAARAMPVLQLMLQKAFQARALYNQRHEPVLPDDHADDELSFFAGRTKVVQNTDSSTPSSQRHSSPGSSGAPTSQSQKWTEYSPSPPPPPASSSSSVNRAPPIPEAYLQSQATFADLTGGWDGLFHEVPQPSYQRSATRAGGHTSNWNQQQPQVYGYNRNAMVDDRWASFMNYSIF